MNNSVCPEETDIVSLNAARSLLVIKHSPVKENNKKDFQDFQQGVRESNEKPPFNLKMSDIKINKSTKPLKIVSKSLPLGVIPLAILEIKPTLKSIF